MSELLGKSIKSIIEVKEESDIDAFLGGSQINFLSEEIKGLDDFELICFLVVKDASMMPKKDMYRLVVAGSRSFTDYNLLSQTLDEYLEDLKKKYNVVILSGTANGADRLGERYADAKGLNVEKHPASWHIYGKGAGPIRNKEMVGAADAAVVFWDGESEGAKDMIENAKAKNIPLKVVKF